MLLKYIQHYLLHTVLAHILLGFSTLSLNVLKQGLASPEQ